MCYIMVLTSQLAKYYIAVFISVNPPAMPPQGWIQMLHPFDTREQCLTEMKKNQVIYVVSVAKKFKKILKKVEMMECMTQRDIDEINDDLGHPPSRRKNESKGI